MLRHQLSAFFVFSLALTSSRMHLIQPFFHQKLRKTNELKPVKVFNRCLDCRSSSVPLRVQNKPSRTTFGSVQKVLAASPAVFWTFKLSNGQDVLSLDGSDDRAEFCKHAHSFLLRAETKCPKLQRTAVLAFILAAGNIPERPRIRTTKQLWGSVTVQTCQRTQQTSAGSWSK